MGLVKVKLPKNVSAFKNIASGTKPNLVTTQSTTKLINSAATFATEGVLPGDLIYKFDGSGACKIVYVQTVDSETEITFVVPSNTVTFAVDDEYYILRLSETVDFYLDPSKIVYMDYSNATATGSYFRFKMNLMATDENELRINYFRGESSPSATSTQSRDMVDEMIDAIEKAINSSYTSVIEFNPISDVRMLFSTTL